MIEALPEGTSDAVVKSLALAAVESGVAGGGTEIVLAERRTMPGGVEREAVLGGTLLFAREEDAEELEGDGLPRAPEWIEVIPAPLPGALPGHVETRDCRRGFLIESPQAMVDKFRAEPEERRRKPIDWEHLNHRNWLSQRSPAAGWIMDLEVRSEAIWARVEWTPEGREDVRLKRFAYISPVVAVEWPANSEGQIEWDAIPKAVEFLDAALTNNPATYIRSLAETPLPEGAPPPPVPEPEDQMQSTRFAASRVPTLQTRTTSGVDMKITPILLTALGLPSNASEADIETRFIERAAAQSDHASLIASFDAKLEAVKVEATAAAKASIADDHAKALSAVKVETLVNQAIADRRIVPAQRAHFTKYGEAQGTEALSEFLATIAVHGLSTEVRQPEPTQGGGQRIELTQVERDICTDLGLTPEQFAAQRAKPSEASSRSRKSTRVEVDTDDDDD